ncbi:hypothetical protein [Blastococcus mobilis]|uniref:Fibronectin type-III domain-containing protein n=1 Tax=Blastococcus mobilis TaxID=1938746 RepID=A0A238WRQ0_9ACTN|nr:hypothetical protein [Blastococcus mobilis]SNR48924.1 hypothetical protein SAMN06272737_10977 [Blastococcus mobilis]
MTAARTAPSPEDSRSAVPGGELSVRRRGTSGIRRVAVLILLTVAVVVGSSMPSWASFADTAAVSTTVATATVAPPTGVTARVTKCTGRFVNLTLDWTASTAARVSGYQVRVYLGEAYQDQPSAGAATTTWQGSLDRYYVDTYTVTFTVRTLTEYGWTAESPRTAQVVC